MSTTQTKKRPPSPRPTAQVCPICPPALDSGPNVGDRGIAGIMKMHANRCFSGDRDALLYQMAYLCRYSDADRIRQRNFPRIIRQQVPDDSQHAFWGDLAVKGTSE